MISASKPLVFVSYSPTDQQFVSWLSPLVEGELARHGGPPISLWRDASISAGSNWADEIAAAVERADCLLVFVSPSYLGSRHARSELSYFLNRPGRRGRIIPVLLDVPPRHPDPLAEELFRWQWSDWTELRFKKQDSPAVQRAVFDLARAIRRAVEEPQPASAAEAVKLERLEVKGFRCFQSLDLHFSPGIGREPSTLGGDWTCIAGINGAGKSSVLQAIAIAALSGSAKELGGGLLKRMRRNGAEGVERATITLTASDGDRRLTSALQIDEQGDLLTDSPSIAESSILVAYGATRNLSRESESSLGNLSGPVQSVIGLLHPLSQVASAEVLLSDRRRSPHLMPLFSQLIHSIFDRELVVDSNADAAEVRFAVTKKDHVDATDLPDGFRSSAAWLADLAATWCNRRPEKAASENPADIEAVVLIDEIDLHLHPSLQRELVPRLRRALPKVQWIVTTHSPLVLANFDRNEIVALDRDREGSVRRLDRQILGFSSDQVYDWLMGTRPTGAEVERMLNGTTTNGAANERLAELMRTTPEVSPEQAGAQVAEFQKILESMKS